MEERERKGNAVFWPAGAVWSRWRIWSEDGSAFTVSRPTRIISDRLPASPKR